MQLGLGWDGHDAQPFPGREVGGDIDGLTGRCPGKDAAAGGASGGGAAGMAQQQLDSAPGGTAVFKTGVPPAPGAASSDQVGLCKAGWDGFGFAACVMATRARARLAAEQPREPVSAPRDPGVRIVLHTLSVHPREANMLACIVQYRPSALARRCMMAGEGPLRIHLPAAPPAGAPPQQKHDAPCTRAGTVPACAGGRPRLRRRARELL